jgi:hypothetical protein
MGFVALIEVFIQKKLRFEIFKAQVFYVECVSKMGFSVLYKEIFWVSLPSLLRLWVDFWAIWWAYLKKYTQTYKNCRSIYYLWATIVVGVTNPTHSSK